LGLAAVGLLLLPVVRRLRVTYRQAPLSPAAAWVLAGGFAIQSFHMLEHGVQVYQVYVAEAQERHGLLGAAVDFEWMHYGFNLSVLAFLAWAFVLLRGRMGTVPGAALLASIAVQGYHMAEHTAKVIQYVTQGVQPAPGLLGGKLGLVWFHYGINLAVYAGTAVAFAAAALTLLRGRVREPAPTLLAPPVPG
jgi:hypothetical protein